MGSRFSRFFFTFHGITIFIVAAVASPILAKRPLAQSVSQPTGRAAEPPHKVAHSDSALDAGSVTAGAYRNQGLAIVCKIPDGWVLRTDEMNSPVQEEAADSAGQDADRKGGRVLLAAFSRPPQARAEDVNASILIAAESAAAYPGLKDAAQYFGPLTEVAKAQGFTPVEEPYEFAVGTKKLVRADFHKDVGTRVMHQSTLVMLARGYAVSFTFIGGTEDEIEALVAGLSFQPAGAKK